MKEIFTKIRKLTSSVLSTLAECIIPNLPIMIGVGMLKVLLIVLGPNVLNLLKETSDTYIVLSFVADAGYYFMPIFTAVSSADVFHTDRHLAALIGAMLLSPAFIEAVKAGNSLSIFSLPIAMTDYGSQVISSIISVRIMSYVSSFLQKHLNENLKAILFPLMIILIMIPISFCAIGPLGVFLGNRLVDLILLLKDLGPIGNAFMCAIIPFITIGGLSGANLSAMLLLASTGVDPILFFSNVLYNNVLGFVTLALYLRNRNPETLASALTAAVGGTSEPALFGIVMKDRKALASLCIGAFISGLISGLFKVKSYAMASFGTFGIVTTIGPDSSIIHAAVSMITGCIIGFILSYLSHPQHEQE